MLSEKFYYAFQQRVFSNTTLVVIKAEKIINALIIKEVQTNGKGIITKRYN